MILQQNIHNILRAGGFLIKYTSGEGLTMLKPVSREVVDPELVRSIYTSAKDSKPGDIGFVYEDTWRKRDRHNGPYLDWTVGSKNPANLKCTRISELVPEGTLYIKSLLETKRLEILQKASEGYNRPETYLGQSVGRLTNNIVYNILVALNKGGVSYTNPVYDYNDFGFNNSYINPEELYNAVLEKKLAGKAKSPKQEEIDKMNEIKYENNCQVALVGSAKGYANSTSTWASKMNAADYVEDYIAANGLDAEEYYGQWPKDPDCLENCEPKTVHNVNPDWIKYLLSLTGEQELNFRATKQIIVRPDKGSKDGFGQEYINSDTQIGHEEVFDRAVSIGTDSAKETSIVQLLLHLAPDLLEQPVLYNLLNGYRFRTKESGYSNGIQHPEYGIVSGLIKYDIHKSIYKVPRSKSCGFPTVKRTVRGVTKEYVNLKELGITKQNEFVCLEETRGRGFSDFKQLWIMYKVYLLMQPNLKKITKAQKEVLNITGVDRKSKDKLLAAIATVRNTGVPKPSKHIVGKIADLQLGKIEQVPNPIITGKYSRRGAGGKADYIPTQAEVNKAIKSGSRIPTTIKLLKNCKEVCEYPTTMGQMFNMVNVQGKWQRQGDRMRSKYIGKVVAPTYAGTFWQPGMPITFGGKSKLFALYGEAPVSNKIVKTERYYIPAPKNVLEIDSSVSLAEHKRWEPVFHFPVKASKCTTSIAWIHLEEEEGTVISWWDRKANYEVWFNASRN